MIKSFLLLIEIDLIIFTPVCFKILIYSSFSDPSDFSDSPEPTAASSSSASSVKGVSSECGAEPVSDACVVSGAAPGSSGSGARTISTRRLSRRPSSFGLRRRLVEEASIRITLAHARAKLLWRGPEPSDASLDGSSPRKSIFGWNTKSGCLRALLDGCTLVHRPIAGFDTRL